MKKTHQIMLALFTGVLVCFSFPVRILGFHAPEMGWLAWVALVPLILAVRDASPRRAFLITFLSGLVWYSGSIFWVYTSMHSFGGLSSLVSFSVLVLLVLVVSLYIALAPMFAKLIETRWRGEMIVLLPVCWTAVEILRNYVPCNGFPWSNVAMSQWKMLPVIQIVDVVGAYGLIFLIVWVNVFISEVVLKLSGRKIVFFAPKCAMTAVFLGATFLYGAYSLYTIPKSFVSSDSLSVGLIQGNVPQNLKWEATRADENWKLHVTAARRLMEAPVEMIIWPEASFPWPMKTTDTNIDPRALGFIETNLGDNPYTLFGVISEKPDGDYYNSAYMFNASGNILGSYNKNHLVPFGEYVPYKKLLFFAKKLTKPVGNFLSGDVIEPIVAGRSKAGVMICYEDAFPEIARRGVYAGANFLATITNDAWFGRSSAPYQHLALSVLRAVENRRFMVRAANSGVSAVVMPTGKVLVQSEIFEPALIVSPIVLLEDLSLYTKLGDWFAWGCLAYMIFGIGAVINGRIKCRRN